ncbi:hypothetical protein [Abiotrophia defectiva]|uniref:hypothetical protein n=1 Tax=Abiotrophia defectiva TaxID=46125 RepID=UPI0026F0C762|nr:hypothetical protein [Abiotrophia defectiva]
MKNKGTVYVIESKGSFLMGYHNDDSNTLTTELQWCDAWEQAQKHFVPEDEEINPVTLEQLKNLADVFDGQLVKVSYEYEVTDLDGNLVEEKPHQLGQDSIERAIRLSGALGGL